MTTAEIRKLFATQATLAQGLRYPDPRYQAFLFPHDTAADAKAFAKAMSSCALFCLALWRALGVLHKLLGVPYRSRVGRAVSDVVEIARACGAWVEARDWEPDKPLASAGDAVLMGGPPGYGGLEHVLVCTGVTADLLTSTDGGQPGIEPRSRLVDAGPQKGVIWLRSLDKTKARRVQGWVDCTKLVRVDRPGPYDEAA